MRRKIAVFLAPVLRSRWLAPSAAVLTAAALIGASFLLSGGPAPSATPLGQRLELDGDGRLTQSIDAAGRVTRLTVGGDGRSRSWDLPDGSKITEEFDEFGRRQAMTDAAGAVHYDHDGFNRLVAVRRDGMPALKFDYDGRGRLKSLDAGGQVVHYQYDFLGRLAAMETPAGAFTFEYPTGDDGGSSIVCRYPNGIRGERRFGPDGRLHVIAYVGADGGSLAEFTYAYRPDGLIGEVRERWPSGERTTSYVYDEVQRLASVVDDRGTTAYHYDLVGDRVEVLGPDKASAASRFDWAGRMLEHRGERCEQDAAGNLTSWAGAAGRRASGSTRRTPWRRCRPTAARCATGTTEWAVCSRGLQGHRRQLFSLTRATVPGGRCWRTRTAASGRCTSGAARRQSRPRRAAARNST